MAKPQLSELFAWLERDPLNRFEIYDVDRNRALEKCASYEDLTAGGKTLEEYFTGLLDQGVKTVQIVRKRKNGSSHVRQGCGLNFSLSTAPENNNVAASGSPDRPGATPASSPNPYAGLMGSNPFGLGFPEIMGMRSEADRFRETKEENKVLKEKVERLEAENRKLETECLTYKIGNDSKPSAVDKLVEGLVSNPQALSALISGFKGGGAPGLNAPQPQKQLSDTKSTVVGLISDNPQITDDHVAASYYVLIEAVKGNEAFMNEYHQLLTKYNLVHGSDSTSDSR